MEQNQNVFQGAAKKSVGRSLRLMFQWMGKFWPLLILSFIFLYFVSYIRSITPLFGQYVIDTVLHYSDKPSTLPDFILKYLTGDTIQAQLLAVALMIVAAGFIRALSIFIRRFFTAIFSENVSYNLRNRLFNQLQNLGYEFHTHSETGDLIQRCTTDVDTYRTFINDQIVEVLRLVLLVGLSIYQMSLINMQLTLISVVITPFIFIIALFYFKKVEKVFQHTEESDARMTTHVQENVSGARVVKAFANEKYEVEKFTKLNRAYTDADYTVVKWMAVFWSATDFICFIQFFLIAVSGIIYATKGIISPGDYTAFLAFSGNIIWPMRQLGRLVGDFSKTTVAIARLDKILSTKDEYTELENQNTPVIKGSVSFKNVRFQFPDSSFPQLEDISFNVKKGETVALIGKTGSGKSTLMNLLVRLLDYGSGSIKIDGNELNTIEKHHLRKHIGMILQEPFLFSKTVKDNISVEQLENEYRTEEVAKIAQVHEDIIHFEQGYETLVGERGVTLSGGQKQRVAIARMLYSPKPILIFDDSLSAIDTKTDKLIRKALKTEWKDSTVFIITHRITSAMEADHIFVLENGSIKEKGTHKELVEKNGLYKKLWDIQSSIDFQLEEEGEIHG